MFTTSFLPPALSARLLSPPFTAPSLESTVPRTPSRPRSRRTPEPEPPRPSDRAEPGTQRLPTRHLQLVVRDLAEQARLLQHLEHQWSPGAVTVEPDDDERFPDAHDPSSRRLLRPPPSGASRHAKGCTGCATGRGLERAGAEAIRFRYLESISASVVCSRHSRSNMRARITRETTEREAWSRGQMSSRVVSELAAARFDIRSRIVMSPRRMTIALPSFFSGLRAARKPAPSRRKSRSARQNRQA